MDLSLVFKQGDPILIIVFASLIVMSLISWYLILRRGWSVWKIMLHNKRLVQQFWAAPDLTAAQSLLVQHMPSPIARIAQAALTGFEHYRKNEERSLGKACGLDEFLVRTIRMRLEQESAQLERGLTWLATIGSVAPFIGLFGTVWGIYHALTAIASSGQGNIGTVAGPIGEALVATAAGLAAAIPAVMAYNAFVRMNRVIGQEMDGFAHDIHAQLLTEGAQ